VKRILQTSTRFVHGPVVQIAVRQATSADVPTMSDILARAFDGPITVWAVPDEEQRVDVMRQFFAAGLEHVWLRHGEVYTTVGEVAGCCIWMPPGAESIRDEQTALFDAEYERIFRDYPRNFQLFTMFDEVHPSEPRYYLPFIAVDPEIQRKGVGVALLAPVLGKCDREGIVAYLEADDRSRQFHERNGFRVIGDISLPDGPIAWQMERLPQSGSVRRPVSSASC
jgi:GNAT superfamily N-acetyltransferase